MASNSPTFELGFLDDFEDLENVSEMVAETAKASKDQQSESATSENNTCTRVANVVPEHLLRCATFVLSQLSKCIPNWMDARWTLSNP